MVPRVSDPPAIMDTPSLESLDNTFVKRPLPVVLEQSRPSPPRRSTAPDSPTESTQVPTSTVTLPSYPRNRSPFTRTHVRSRSSNSSLSAPLMARAHSSPVPDNKTRPLPPFTARPSSPLGPPGRHRSPLRKATDEPFSSFSNHLPIGETISENHELDLTPRTPAAGGSSSPTESNISIHNTFPRTRRRPSSPFYPSSQNVYLNTSTTTSIPLRTSTSSPSLHVATQYNEPFPSSSSSPPSPAPSSPSNPPPSSP